MKEDKQRIAIAESVGRVQRSDGFWYPEGCNVGRQGIPDHLNDLNAMHEVEKALLISSFMWETYNEILTAISDCNEYNPIGATAAQRAEALLKTINKWEYAD